MTTNAEDYILLVDDNKDDVDLTIRAITQGCLTNKVVVMCDGQQALDYLFTEGEFKGQEHKLPAVVLLDLNMPRVGGLEALKRIRSDPRTEILPVVVLTTSDEQSDVLRSYKLGANSFVQKPVDVGQFFKAIQELHVFWTVRNVTPPKA